MPFIETALFSTPTSEDGIVHFGAVRYRVDGAGNLITTLYGYDKLTSNELLPLAMSSPASRELTRLANFNSQKALIRVETTEINEVMKFNRIILFARDVFATYPGQ